MTVTSSSPQRAQSPRIELKIALARGRRIGELSAKCPICGKPIQDSLEMHEVLLTKGDVQGAPDAVRERINCAENCVLVHPECPESVTSRADFVGSTAQIIDFAAKSPAKKLLIGTEMGILHILEKQNPDKQFFLLTPKLFCVNMKKTHLSDVYEALLHEQHEIVLDETVMDKARLSLDRMLQMS